MKDFYYCPFEKTFDNYNSSSLEYKERDIRERTWEIANKIRNLRIDSEINLSEIYNKYPHIYRKEKLITENTMLEEINSYLHIYDRVIQRIKYNKEIGVLTNIGQTLPEKYLLNDPEVERCLNRTMNIIDFFRFISCDKEIYEKQIKKKYIDYDIKTINEALLYDFKTVLQFNKGNLIYYTKISSSLNTELLQYLYSIFKDKEIGFAININQIQCLYTDFCANSYWVNQINALLKADRKEVIVAKHSLVIVEIGSNSEREKAIDRVRAEHLSRKEDPRYRNDISNIVGTVHQSRDYDGRIRSNPVYDEDEDIESN